MTSPDRKRLRAQAVSHTLFPPTSLAAAIGRLGFVQADPIRAPARAQDLILRHRVNGYRAGDLEARYASLDLEEDYLTVYGFLPRPTWDLLHPRLATEPTAFEREVLAAVIVRGTVHPRDLAATFGDERVVNAWGGQSRSTTRALDRLHDLGLVRIVRRERGIRVFGPSARPSETLEPDERLRRLALVFANLLAPLPVRTFQQIVFRLRRTLGMTEPRPVLDGLLGTGALESADVDGLAYLRPAGFAVEEREHDVRFLAPFDPVVWDRTRFEHLWEWPYRFEAYTPENKRLRGYYAMPLLWHDSVIGWANVRRTPGGELDIDLGFARAEPKGRAFRAALDREIRRTAAFLAPAPPAST